MKCEKSINNKLRKKVNRMNIKLECVHDPLYGKQMLRLIQHKGTDKRIILKTNEMEAVVSNFVELSKGEGACKVSNRIKQIYTAPGREFCNKFMKKLREKQVLKPILTNEDPQKTIVARSPMERHQIDLINMSAYASEIGGKVYKYILSIIDIFTRFLWLIPLENAQSASVTEALRTVYLQWGVPHIIQCDNGSEFKGVTEKLCEILNIQIIHGRPHHPQSQGKVSDK